MKTLRVSDFSLASTLESGQVFRYHLGSGGFYCVVAGNSIIKLQQEGNIIRYACSNPKFGVAIFLGLSHDYGSIMKSISKDEKISAAIKAHYGLRILGQPVWECTASFICSSFSNIPRIKRCLESVAATFGSKLEFDGLPFFSFPQPQQISSLSKLQKCGLGYRAKYLFEAAKIFSGNSSGYSLQQLRKLSYEGAKKRLMELPGVGSKVADCILLFSCGFYEAFPVDVWVMRAMVGQYGNEIKKFAAAKKPNEKIIADFARSHFGKYAGYAQQFIYHDARTSR
ncbi:DNA repair protein [Candidatus Woesearchaeota archaeon]|nr:DNA repair protein [Candidatus Woesearchaeota archaeon]